MARGDRTIQTYIRSIDEEADAMRGVQTWERAIKEDGSTPERVEKLAEARKRYRLAGEVRRIAYGYLNGSELSKANRLLAQRAAAQKVEG
jgi:predicted ArsR family transcriptional regulator